MTRYLLHINGQPREAEVAADTPGCFDTPDDAGFQIRIAQATDAPALQALYQQLVANPTVSVLPERVAQLAAGGPTALLVCENEGAVIATVLVSLCADVMYGNQPFAVVENVVVDAAFRGRGVGTALMRAIESLCQRKGCSKIMLLSSAQRPEAHRFFEGVGFTGEAKRAFVKYRRQFEWMA
jgi:N-acetylglutamate synthase-like GNAT family acetyltransferase